MKRIFIIVGSVLAVLGIGYIIYKSPKTDETDKKNTGSTGTGDTDTGKTNTKPGVVVYPDGGENEKVSKQLRSMNARNTSTIISMWTNPYDSEEYFVKYDDVLTFKVNKVKQPTQTQNLDVLPYGLTLISLVTPTIYKLYDKPRIVKGIGVVEGYVDVSWEMIKDLKILASQSPAISIYTT